MLDITLIKLDSVDSTNSYAKSHFPLVEPGTIVCIATDEQTKGRGRFQRSWRSIKGKSLCATFVFTLPASSLHLTSIGEILALSFAKVLLSESLSPQIKWPNDILLSGKKVAGILAEMQFLRDQSTIFLGIGINVNLSSDELASIDQPATSLLEETGRIRNLDLVLKHLTEQFAEDFEVFRKTGFASFRDPFEHLLAYKGRPIRIFDGQTEWVGICHSIASDGRLNLSLANGSVRSIAAGDLSLP